MIASLGKAIVSYPGSFANWACLLQEMITGTNEIAIVGERFPELHHEVLRGYIPHRVLMATGRADPGFPLLAEKQGANNPSIYLCRNYTCRKPVFSVKDLMSLIDNPPNP